MKRFVQYLLLSVTLLAALPQSVYSFPGYRIMYKEQLYKLYQKRLYMYPENFAENILWLEEILRADFANPLNAMATIKDKRDWQWYRNLFLMHVNLLLVKEYLGWAVGYMKFEALFYNAPWRDMTIRSMKKARRLVEYAKVYWDETLKYVDNVQAMNLNFYSLPRIQNWEDEYNRILRNTQPYSMRAESLEYKRVFLMNKTLDYGVIINRELKRIDDVMAKFANMDDITY